jgi:hypothetical protein
MISSQGASPNAVQCLLSSVRELKPSGWECERVNCLVEKERKPPDSTAIGRKSQKVSCELFQN